MNNLSRTLGAAAVCSVLVACGGSGSGTADRQSFDIPAADQESSVIVDDAVRSADNASSTVSAVPVPGAATGGEQSILLEGEPKAALAAAVDLSIANVEVTAGDRGFSFVFDVADSDNRAIDLNTLSVALEVASGGSFADSYRIPVFDIRDADENQSGGTAKLSARSTEVELPDGGYDARLVVNPNWQYLFNVIPPGHSDTQPFRYLEESDYQNNAGNIFRIEVNGDTVCTEDMHENNNSVAQAVPVSAGDQIEASLCLDDVDFYSLVLAESEEASLTFAYTDEETNPNPATQYVVLNSSFDRITDPTVAREANRIVIKATNAGEYYVALFGKRSSYRITRAAGGGFFDDVGNDSFFHPETIDGPQSWLLGGITLHRLAFTEASLRDQVVNCGRIATQFRDNQPVAYVTPDHFAEIHEFRFLSDSGYLVDGERHNGWHIQDGDITHADWYSNSYPGYAERVSGNSWRYWSVDGLGYVECTLEINR